MEEHQYNYSGLPLTPGIAVHLVLELFAGRITERHKIIDAVVRAHRERGGLDSKAQDTPRMVKKALSDMERDGLAENPSYGQWKVKSAKPDIAAIVPTEVQIDEAAASVPAPELVTGIGEDSVYLYYFESYRRLAEIEGRRLFPCKIGRTERDPLLRVLSQSSTALPEFPRVARLFRTNDGSALEAAIHSILSLRGREIEDSPGTEWFLTSPDEIDGIVRFVNENPGREAEPNAPRAETSSGRENRGDTS
ncbi:MAG: GIY-YIG nuclease family protein [Verrucomicrobia bacterium]|nr:GIY-YIG nuclease family protein [Verrucomicrobiota bacterium]